MGRPHGGDSRKIPINQCPGLGNPVILECKKSRVALFGPPHIELQRATGFGGHDRVPQKPGHASQAVVRLVRTSIFIVNNIPKPEGENRGYRFRVAIGNANRDRLAVVLNQVPEPTAGDGGQSVPAPCENEESVKIPYQLVRGSPLLNQASSPGSLNAA